MKDCLPQLYGSCHVGDDLCIESIYSVDLFVYNADQSFLLWLRRQRESKGRQLGTVNVGLTDGLASYAPNPLLTPIAIQRVHQKTWIEAVQ